MRRGILWAASAALLLMLAQIPPQIACWNKTSVGYPATCAGMLTILHGREATAYRIGLGSWAYAWWYPQSYVLANLAGHISIWK